jgi:hypothetical protein
MIAIGSGGHDSDFCRPGLLLPSCFLKSSLKGKGLLNVEICLAELSSASAQAREPDFRLS